MTTRARVAVVGFLVLVATAGWADPPPSILVNGDFEEFSGPEPIGWDGLTSGDLTTAVTQHGQWAAFIDHTGSTSSGPWWSQGWIPVTAGAAYVLTGWLRCDQFSGDGWGQIRIGIVQSDWSEVAASPSELLSYCGDGVFHKVAVSFSPTGTQVLARFGIFGPKENATLFFDDLRLFAKTSNSPPYASPTGSPLSGEVPLTVQFAANADDDDGAVRHFVWDFGDGGAARSSTPSYVYRSGGDFAVSLTVVDNDGASSTYALAVASSDPSSPQVSIDAPTSDPQWTTTSPTVVLSGSAQPAAGTGSSLQTLTWDNLDAVATETVSPSSSWTTGEIDLEPGRNRLLVTVIDGEGRVGTDLLEVFRSLTAPALGNIQTTTGPVPRNGRWQATFELDTVATHPLCTYDPAPPPGVPADSGVTVDATITTPSSLVVTQPAYFTTRVETSGSHLVETMDRQWAVQFTPREIGWYDVTLEATDASGTSTLAIGGFETVPSTLPGFVQVSDTDSRYFERDDGSLFFPIGPALDDASPVNDGVLTIRRPWMGGYGAYSTNWSRWISSAEQHGNEGFMAPLSFNDRAPGSELSFRLFCESTCGADDSDLDGWRLWQGWMIQDTAPLLLAGHRYRVVLRLKTAGLQPATAGNPFGVTMKIHGWRGSSQTWKEYLDGLPASYTMVEPIGQDRPWHTVVSTFISPVQATYVSVYLHNVAAGVAFVDTISVCEVDGGGSVVGGELIRDHQADLHLAVDPRGAALLDEQLRRAEADGVTLKLVVQDKNDWVPNHLTSSGFFSTVGDGYYQPNGTRTRWLQNQWWRYIAARWGASTAIHSLELLNEGSPDSQSHYQAAQDFAAFVTTTGAHPHLATTSFWCCWRPELWGDELNYPDVGYADLHEYTDNSGLGGLQDELEQDLAGLHLYLVDKVKAEPVDKPVVRAESGIASASTNFEVLGTTPNPGWWYHNLLWAQLDSSAVTDVNYWWSQHFRQVDQWTFGGDMNGLCRVELARGFASFVAGLDLNLGGYEDLDASVSNPELRVVGQKNQSAGRAHLWVQNRQHTWKTIMDAPGSIVPQFGTIGLDMGTPESPYVVAWWSTTAGVVASSQTLTADGGGVVTLTVPSLSGDTAAQIEPGDGSGLIFAHGFEDGDTRLWSQTEP